MKKIYGDITNDTSIIILFSLKKIFYMGYIDKAGALTDKYHEDKNDGNLILPEEVKDAAN